MKKLIVLMMSLVVLLAACGSIANDLKGHKFKLTQIGGTDNSTSYIQFEDDGTVKSGSDSSNLEEKGEYSVKDDVLTIKDENASLKISHLKKQNNKITGKYDSVSYQGVTVKGEQIQKQMGAKGIKLEPVE